MDKDGLMREGVKMGRLRRRCCQDCAYGKLSVCDFMEGGWTNESVVDHGAHFGVIPAGEYQAFETPQHRPQTFISAFGLPERVEPLGTRYGRVSDRAMAQDR